MEKTGKGRGEGSEGEGREGEGRGGEGREGEGRKRVMHIPMHVYMYLVYVYVYPRGKMMSYTVRRIRTRGFTRGFVGSAGRERGGEGTYPFPFFTGWEDPFAACRPS